MFVTLRRGVFHTLALAGLVVAGFAGRLSAADFQYPLSVAAADDGTVYVADRNLPGVWKLSNGKAEVFFRASKQFRTPLNAVRCVAIDHEGRLLAGDSATREVYRFDDEGQPVPLTDGGIGIPMDIAVDGQGNLFVADLEVHRIWKVAAEGGEPVEFAEVPAPRGVAFDGEGRLWVVSHGRNQLVRLTAEGQVEPVVTERTFQFPHVVRFDHEGTPHVTDGYARAVWRIDADGTAAKWISGEPLVNPVGLARRGEHLLVVDPRANAVFQADAEGRLTKTAGPGEP